MRTKIILIGLVLELLTQASWANLEKELPARWGPPPEIQTQDYVPLPGGFGFGSSTMRQWIAAKLAAEQTLPVPAKPAGVVLYTNDFEQAAVGAPADEFMVLGGEFVVKSDGTNKFLELPGAPLDSFAIQFGPAESSEVAAQARFFGTSKGRRAPSFGIGLGGVSGYKLVVAPAKKQIQLLKDQELRATVPFDWPAGTWTELRLQIQKTSADGWAISGKAWPANAGEPKDWLLTHVESEAPVAGKASVFGSPFAGTPIWFDDLRVERAAAK